MATIEQFNEVIERAKTKADFSAVVWMKRTDAQVGVTSIQKRKNQLSVFRQVIAWKDTDHVAIIANGHVMAIWHAQPANVTAQAAFGVGDLVVIREDAEQDTDELRAYQILGLTGRVVRIDEDGVVVSFQSDEWLLTADELELWKPAEPDEYTRDEEQARLIARIRELEEVVEPFAKIGSILRTMPQPYIAWNCYISGHPGVTITLQDAYAAYEALAEPVTADGDGVR